MQQTRLISAVEALTNIAIGMGVALASQYVIFPIVGIYSAGTGDISFVVHLQITAFFTVVSFARSYLVRRYFETHLKTIALKVAGAVEKLKWAFMSLVGKK